MKTRNLLGCAVAAGVSFASTLAACSQPSTAPAGSVDSGARIEVALESCNKSYELELPAPPSPSPSPSASAAAQPAQAQTFWYAEHPYPRRTKEDLAGRVKNWVKVADLPPVTPLAQRYEWEPQFQLYIRDGMVAVPCGSANQTTMFVYTP
jgi:hypothetical protein